jgi:hypothetical protein
MAQRPPENSGPTDRPPLFSTWGRMYLAVLLILAGQIAVFYLLTRIFR